MGVVGGVGSVSPENFGVGQKIGVGQNNDVGQKLAFDQKYNLG